MCLVVELTSVCARMKNGRDRLSSTELLHQITSSPHGSVPRWRCVKKDSIIAILPVGEHSFGENPQKNAFPVEATILSGSKFIWTFIESTFNVWRVMRRGASLALSL